MRAHLVRNNYIRNFSSIRSTPWFAAVIQSEPPCYHGCCVCIVMPIGDGQRVHLKRILGECLLISSLPGKVLRTLADIARLASDSTSVLKPEPGKLDTKRRAPGILFIRLPIVSLFKLAIMKSFSSFVFI